MDCIFLTYFVDMVYFDFEVCENQTYNLRRDNETVPNSENSTLPWKKSGCFFSLLCSPEVYARETPKIVCIGLISKFFFHRNLSLADGLCDRIVVAYSWFKHKLSSFHLQLYPKPGYSRPVGLGLSANLPETTYRKPRRKTAIVADVPSLTSAT